MKRITSKGSGTLGFAFFSGLAISLWSANAGVKAVFDALNVAYDEEVLLLPILALCGDENGESVLESVLELDPDAEDRMMAEAAEFIPACVSQFAGYWRKRGPLGAGSGPSPSAGLKPNTTGRKDPCPCGSGGRYKY